MKGKEYKETNGERRKKKMKEDEDIKVGNIKNERRKREENIA